MALLWIDGFDLYDNTYIDGAYEGGAGNIDTSNYRHGRAALGDGSSAEKYLDANYQTLIVGFAYYNPGPGGASDLIVLKDGTNTQILIKDSNGDLEIKRGFSLLANVPNVFPLNRWLYVEVKVTIDNSAGAVEVRIDGVTVASLSGIDTQNTGNNYVNRVTLDGGCYKDDFYICDTSGAKNNDFLGDIAIEAVVPDANGTNQDWTPSAGSDHYAVIDEVPPNGDSDYLSTGSTGQKETNQHAALTLTGSVLGVQQMHLVRKDDAGSWTVKPICKSGSTESAGSALAVSDTYTYVTRILEDDPDTGADWLPAGVNAAEWGIES